MNPFKFIWKHLGTRIWLLVSSIALAFVLIVTLVGTQQPFLRGTLNLVFGFDRAVIAEERKGLFALDEGINSPEEMLAKANAFNETVEEEGIVLLKNNNNTLPLHTPKSTVSPASANPRVTVFGKNSVNLVVGGSGSADGSSSDNRSVYDSLTAAGYEFNTTMREFYTKSASGNGRPKNPNMGAEVFGFATGENPNGYSSVRSSYGEYDDAAIVIISRIGGEGYDLPRTMRTQADPGHRRNETTAGARSQEDHYLQLDKNEVDMINEACANFEKVIVVFNTAQTVEAGFLEEDSLYNTLKNYNIDASQIDAVLWMGLPGSSGAMALGRVLNGNVNPSGHTTDTWATDFTKTPSYYNFGSNNMKDGNRYLVKGSKADAFYTEYEEGIYVGYRYYETRGFTDGEEWYKNNVVYPFGYGKSYSDFSWTVKNCSIGDNAVLTGEDEITVTVTVTNNGDYAGKDVVQLYFTAPYSPGGIEKSHVVLGDFVKTPLIPAGESRDVNLSMKVSDMKSYDYQGLNKSNFKGYILEAGDYSVSISYDAHTPCQTYGFNVAEDETYRKDAVTGYDVVNRYDDVSEHIEKYLSRNDWEGTMPTPPTDAEKEVSAQFIESLIWKKNDAGQPWEATELPATNQPGEIKFTDMYGVDYNDEKWDELLDQMSVGDMAMLIGKGAFSTVNISSIGKMATREFDGPSGWNSFMGNTGLRDTNCFYVAECIMGATWNEELAYQMGRMIGNEALVGLTDGSPMNAWYAPAVNIHRSPFGGRNWEYYSEDGLISGRLATQVILGAKEKGVVTYLKHFVLNDNETSRDDTGSEAGNARGLGGILVWANEQAMREIYFKPFEIAVKEGKTTGMMSSFNRVGTEWVGGSYRTLTEVLRNEWGFKGSVITDYGIYNFVNEDQMIRAGGDLRLNQDDRPSANANDATQVACLRRATKNILYASAQSNVMDINVLGYKPALWVVGVICADVGLAAAFAVWGALIIYFTLKKEKGSTARTQTVDTTENHE